MTETYTPEVLGPETTALEAMERASIDIAIATAKRYPRSLQKFKAETLSMATLTEEIAESCFYRLEKGGSIIEGPSVRLAEIAASSYGNIRTGGRIIGIDDKHVTAQGVCHDLERNVSVSAEIKRRITDRNGRLYSDDMIQTTAQAAISLAIRNAILKVIPRAYVDSMMPQIKKTAIGSAATLAARRQKALEWFNKAGASKERVLAALGREGVDDVNLDDLERLSGWKTAIAEKETSLDELIPVLPKQTAPAAETTGATATPAPETRAEGLAQKLRGRKKAEPKTEEQEPPANTPTIDSEFYDRMAVLHDQLVAVAGEKPHEIELALAEATAGKVTSFNNPSKIAEHFDEIAAWIQAKEGDPV
jgi:hypothetical protein